jgi:hypothetical protein
LVAVIRWHDRSKQCVPKTPSKGECPKGKTCPKGGFGFCFRFLSPHFAPLLSSPIVRRWPLRSPSIPTFPPISEKIADYVLPISIHTGWYWCKFTKKCRPETPHTPAPDCKFISPTIRADRMNGSNARATSLRSQATTGTTTLNVANLLRLPLVMLKFPFLSPRTPSRSQNPSLSLSLTPSPSLTTRTTSGLGTTSELRRRGFRRMSSLEPRRTRRV